MRFPIRSQLLVLTSIVMITVVVGSAGLNTWLVQRAARLRIHGRIEEVTEILEHASFPLTEHVLGQMAGLAGAEFVLTEDSGMTIATSDEAFRVTDRSMPEQNVGELGKMQTVAGREYFHRVLPLDSDRHRAGLQLHVFFAAEEYRRIWQRALAPSLLAVGIALAASIACAYWVGSWVGMSTQAILHQLERVAAGHFQPAPLPAKNDELRDIFQAVNHTATLLAEYESNVREGERMKTMVAMGAGLAHQIRNSVTGCRMALDIHAEEQSLGDQEALQVARRQLSRMENYLQRFLLLAQVKSKESNAETAGQSVADLNEIVSQAVSLVEHSARHLLVDVQWTPADEKLTVEGDIVAMEQATVNLLLNAMEAASAEVVKHADTGTAFSAVVRVEIERSSRGMFPIVVRDNGAGPPRADQDLFTPFVTGKKSGVGLGLAVVREVAREHGGQASWRRKDGWTEFVLELAQRGDGEE